MIKLRFYSNFEQKPSGLLLNIIRFNRNKVNYYCY